MTIDYREELQKLLRKLFQFDSADLDFGIYRILNQKREIIKKFIEEDLIETIDKEYDNLLLLGKSEIESELDELKNEIVNNLGKTTILPNGNINPAFIDLPITKKYLEKKKLTEKQAATEQEIGEIFSHIYHFFSRYYDEGDFISKRRYGKNEKYVIPYNGEEVLLHWANNDQYFIKTTEWFTKYTFKKDNFTVNFRIIEAEDEIGNVKADAKRFFLLQKDFLEYQDKELDIILSYRTLSDEEIKIFGSRVNQDNINEFLIKEILLKIKELNNKDISINEKLLEKHLLKYTKRNTSDYYIHKNLKGFLEKELDFYLMNEILRTNIEEKHIENQLLKIKVIKNIAERIIMFLAQIEEFQKRLHEKKKFVIETDYCITLDKIPKELYDEILSNKEQFDSWNAMYKLKNKEQKSKNKTLDTFSKLDTKYLEINKFYMVDTKYFSSEFKDKLISSFKNIDQELNGILLKSENYQALNLLLNKYKEEIKLIYIDPPYNTGSDGFIYKDNYQTSSWISMLYDRLLLARNILSDEGAIFISIDDNELNTLISIMNDIFGKENFVCNFIRKSGIAPRQDAQFIATQHDYIVCYAKNYEKLVLNRKKSELKGFDFTDKFVNERGKYRLNKLDRGSIRYSDSLDYPIQAPDGSKIWPGGDPNDKVWTWRWSKEKVKWGIENDYIVIKKNKKDGYSVYYKEYVKVDNSGKPKVRTNPYTSFILDAFNEKGSKELNDLFGSNQLFSYPKPTELIEEILEISTDENSIVLDFFAGSGTTAHSVFNANKNDNGNRKYIIVEMGDYFENVIIPRMVKLAFSSNWKNGQPLDNKGTSQFFKYQTIEQYDDTLNNIEFTATDEIQKTLENFEDYFLNYLLKYETNNISTSLSLNILSNPFNYKLKINKYNDITNTTIDLVETFNYLLGIQIEKIIAFYDNTLYKVIFGKIKDAKIVVIWRNLEQLDLKKDKEFLEKIILKDVVYDNIYINGNSYLKNAILIDEKIKTLMGL